MTARSLVGLALVARVASAQSADAERLFEDGRRLLGEGHVAEACDAFDASYRAEANVSTLMNLADCRERNGQLATAWADYVSAANQTAGRGDRSKMHAHAASQAVALEARLSYLIINVPDDSRIDGLVVTRNSVAVDPGAWNRALPIDAGTYVIAGKAPGHESWSTTVVVARESDRQSADVPRFKALPPPPMPISVTPPVAQDVVSDKPPARSWWRPSAEVASAGSGLVMVVGGVVVDVIARNKYDAATHEVDDTRQHQLYESAVTLRYVAQVMAGVGVAAIGVSAWLWLGDRPAKITPVISPNGVGIAGGF